MSNELTVDLKKKIYEIRGKQVMLDSDLADIYHCKNGTKEINQAVKNNPKKFPEYYTWILTDDESNDLLVKIFDQKNERRGGRYKNPRVFTEQGVYMLATILKSDVATDVTIKIMDTFVEMRKYISSGLIEYDYLNKKIIDHDNKIKLLEESFSEYDKKEDKEIIFFEGQYFRSYSKVINLFKKAKKSLIIIDNFVDNDTLDIISNLNNIKVTIITDKSTCYIKQIDIDKYSKEFSNLSVVYNKTFHDRFFIIDKKDIYHCGASIKDLGNKTFAINKLVEDSVNNNLLNKILSIILIK